jgi:hypothetical protein
MTTGAEENIWTYERESKRSLIISLLTNYYHRHHHDQINKYEKGEASTMQERA